MERSSPSGRRNRPRMADRQRESGHRILTDGGHESDDSHERDDETASDAEEERDVEEKSDTDAESDTDEVSGVDRANVEVTEAGDASPVDPKWKKPDIEDIPEVEGPKTRPAETDSESDDTRDKSGAGPGNSVATAGSHAPDSGHIDAGHPDTDHTSAGDRGDDPTAGMPNTARTPGQSRLKEGGADGYVVALELCARLPDEVRLPDEAADLVPVALEAELEQDVQSFAAEEFDNPAPHVETLEFVEVDEELWLRLRLGIDPDAFADLDPDAIRDHALQQIDGLL